MGDIGGARPIGRSTWSSYAAGVGLFVSTCFPFNTVRLSPLTTVVAAILMVAAVVSVPTLVTSRRARYLLAVLLAPIVATICTHPSRVIQVVLLVCAGVVGLTFATSRRPVLLSALSGVIAFHLSALLYEHLSGETVFDVLGLLPRVDYSAGRSARLQGLMGHPLVSAYVVYAAVCLLSLLLAARRPVLSLGVLLAVLAPAATLTGSRSVLALGVITVVGVVLHSFSCDRVTHVARTVQLGLMIAVLASVVLHLSSGISTTSLRVLDFADLTTQSSFTVRTNVIHNLAAAEGSTRCGPVCTVIGHGYRASTDFLLVHPPAPLVATFDNSFATLWFDFRVVGVFIVGAILWPLRAWRSRSFKAVFVTSAVVFAPNFFFDALYSFGMVAFTGLMIGVLLDGDANGLASRDGSRHAEERRVVLAS